MPSDWITPDSDVANGWNNPANAYDENTGSYASASIPKFAWGPYLELWLDEALTSTKVRIWSIRSSLDVDQIAVDVYYGGAWHNIYSGALTVGAYVEYAIGSEQAVTAMRMRYHNSTSLFVRSASVCEADFWGYYSATGRSFGSIIG